MHVFAKLKLTYALQNTPKALSVSSFEAPEVIPTQHSQKDPHPVKLGSGKFGKQASERGRSSHCNSVVLPPVPYGCCVSLNHQPYQYYQYMCLPVSQCAPSNGLFPAKWKWAFERVVGFGIFGLGYAPPTVSFPIIIATPTV